MAYGTKNYNVLGLVIEAVTGQSYESFMEEHIFLPLGLTQTFANRDHAIATNHMASGYTITFNFMTLQRNSPEARGSVPTGYIISSTQDMARWMGIQLGLVDDIPEIFRAIIPRSHEQGKSVVGTDGSYYAAGWFVNEDGSLIEHAGGNVGGFSTNILLFPNEQIGISLLSNGTSVNIDMLHNVRDILDGSLQQRYPLDLVQILDIVFSVCTIAGIPLAISFIFLGIRRKKQVIKRSFSKKRIVLISYWTISTLFMCVLLYLFPREILSNYGWGLTLSIAPFYSFLTGIISLVLLNASITWFVVLPRCRK